MKHEVIFTGQCKIPLLFFFFSTSSTQTGASSQVLYSPQSTPMQTRAAPLIRKGYCTEKQHNKQADRNKILVFSKRNISYFFFHIS